MLVLLACWLVVLSSCRLVGLLVMGGRAGHLSFEFCRLPAEGVFIPLLFGVWLAGKVLSACPGTSRAVLEKRKLALLREAGTDNQKLQAMVLETAACSQG